MKAEAPDGSGWFRRVPEVSEVPDFPEIPDFPDVPEGAEM